VTRPRCMGYVDRLDHNQGALYRRCTQTMDEAPIDEGTSCIPGHGLITDQDEQQRKPIRSIQ
jgi:hypothetical protein